MILAAVQPKLHCFATENQRTWWISADLVVDSPNLNRPYDPLDIRPRSFDLNLAARSAMTVVVPLV